MWMSILKKLALENGVEWAGDTKRARNQYIIAVHWIWQILSDLTNQIIFFNSKNFKSNQIKKRSNPNQSEIDLILVKSKSFKSNPLKDNDKICLKNRNGSFCFFFLKFFSASDSGISELISETLGSFPFFLKFYNHLLLKINFAKLKNQLILRMIKFFFMKIFLTP